MNGYSVTNPDFVDNPRKSNTSATIDKAVIRNDTGNLQVWQCSGKTKVVRGVSRNVIVFQDKTAGDLLIQFKRNRDKKKLVLGY